MVKSEKDIISLWKNEIQAPLVSICCITYNHKFYIEDALIGFLIQETDFPFEIIIHDDASDDGTIEILKKYANDYPNIIKPIFQNQNQFSKNKFSLLQQVFNLSRGDFIALCEGDDYWTSPEKLTKQVTIMKNYPNINISFHPCSKIINNNIIKESRTYKDGIYSLKECLLTDFHFIETNTIVFKRSVLKIIDYKFLSSAPVVDVFLRIWASYQNGALCINDDMSVYRVSSVGSWTNRHLSCFNKFNFVKAMLKACDEILIGLPISYNIVFYKYKLNLINLLNNCNFKKNSEEYLFLHNEINKYSLTVKIKIKLKRMFHKSTFLRFIRSYLNNDN